MAIEGVLSHNRDLRIGAAKEARRRKWAVAVLVLLVVAVSGVVLAMYLGEHDVGEACRYDSECGSRHCLHGVTLIGLVDYEHPGYCSDLCTKDGECPRGMHCGDVRASTSTFDSVASHGQPAKACIK